MITGQTILILSTQDWDAMPTRKHRWARQFAEQGNRVLYVEQQMHWAGWLIDLRRQVARLWRWLQMPREVAPNLRVYTLPLVLPFFQMWAPLNWLNNLGLTPVLRWALARLGWTEPVLWTYTPHSADFIGRLGERLVVYECVDEFSASKGLVHGPTVAALERRVLAGADQVIVTAQALYEAKAGDAQRIALVPNGADVDHFAVASAPDTALPDELRALPRPILGFVGAVQYWVDFDLLKLLAESHPEWSLVFVGPVEPLARIDLLRGLPNVHFLGRRPYAEVPRYVAGFDVCLNPYILDGVAEACSPIKLYEYMASGKPLVSVDMPAARDFAGLIPLTSTAEGFLRAVEQTLAEQQNGRALAGRLARQQAARSHSWQARFEAVQAVVAPLMGGAA